jgi:exodeoxyribonuclease VII large subunit
VTGHWYLDVAERDPFGKVLAQTRAIIWRRNAEIIVSHFARSTGAELAPGVKLLVRVRPEFHPQYGFSLHIDAIDPTYTLGELEARRRQIRTRLKSEGVFQANRSLPPVWDYTRVLVLAPNNAAGLGDFRSEATRLEHHGLCSFVYVHSRFQGEGAPAEMIGALRSALERSKQHTRSQLDAIVIIRGGGSANDLSWLDDYALTSFICNCPIPVLTGIGHERDNTLLDEVAHRRYDTPSKVVAGIEQHIYHRTREAKTLFQAIESRAREVTASTHRLTETARNELRDTAFRQLEFFRRHAYQLYSNVCHRTRDSLRDSAGLALKAFTDVLITTQGKTASVATRLATLFAQLNPAAGRHLRAAYQDSRKLLGDIHSGARENMETARIEVRRELDIVSTQARTRTTELNRQLPALLVHVTLSARHMLKAAQSATERDIKDAEELSWRASKTHRRNIDLSLQSIAHDAWRLVGDSRASSENILREIASQGPQKTLSRGFVIARDQRGLPLTTAAAAHTHDVVELQFSDGSIPARILQEK